METLDKITEKALQYLNSAEAFAKTEIPIYIEELLTFKFYENMISCIMISISFLTLSAFAGYLYYKIFVEKSVLQYGTNSKITRYQNDDELIFPSILIGLIYLLISMLLVSSISSSVVEMVKIKTAPRVYLIDYIRNQAR